MKNLIVLACSFLSGVASSKRLARAAGKKVGGRLNADHTLGFLLGLGVGAGCALLFAPKAGADTRSMIDKKAKEGSAYLKQQAEDLSDAAANIIREGRKEAARAEKSLVDAVHA